MSDIPASIGNTLGASFLGGMAAATLFGLTNLQMYVYFTEYPQDWKLQRLSVGLLWLLDAFHLALTVHVMYHYVIELFGNAGAVVYVVWSLKLQIAVNVVIIVFVQSLYGMRLWKLGRAFHGVLPWMMILVVLTGYAIGILLVMQTYKISTFGELQSMKWVVILSFSAATAIDFIFAIGMCFYLQRSRFGFSLMNSKILILMRYVVISGLATSAVSVLALITFLALPNTLVFLGIEFLLTKVYINSWMAMLNARRSIRNMTAQSMAVTASTGFPTRSTNLDFATIPARGESVWSSSVPLDTIPTSHRKVRSRPHSTTVASRNASVVLITRSSSLDSPRGNTSDQDSLREELRGNDGSPKAESFNE